MNKDTQDVNRNRRSTTGHLPGASVEDMAAAEIAGAIHKARSAGMCDKCITDVLSEFGIKGRAK